MMKVSANTVFEILSRLRIYFQGATTIRRYGNEEPFRSDLYSAEQMNEHGRVIARSHHLMKGKPTDQLLKRLDDNEKTLLEVRNLLVENARSEKTVSPGAEWLLDNFYLVEEQVVLARKHLPKGYSEALPCLADGISAGMPRVYDLVLEIISHSDGRVDASNLGSFVAAYQSNTLLTLGELWAIPIMLRLAVIENLRRVCGKIALDMVDHNLADYWADKMMATVKAAPGELILTIADMVRSKPPLSSPFVAGFTRSLQGKGPVLAMPLNWLQQELSAIGADSNDMVRQENQKQAADQVSVRNSIGTLRFIGATDWRDFVEALSSVEQALRKDPAGIYPLMDFNTRDRYRHVVEGIAKNSYLNETEVAMKVVELAGEGGKVISQEGLSGKKEVRQPVGRDEHVGYYLIDKGLSRATRVPGMQFSLKERFFQRTRRVPLLIYLGSISIIALLASGAMFYLAYSQGVNNRWLLALTGILSLSAAAQLGVSLVNWLSSKLVRPQLLPRLDFSKGIPADCRTLVVVPTLLSSAAYIGELLEGLEMHYLANKVNYLHFALLTDFMDADTESKPGDQELVELARLGIEALNQKYSSTGNTTAEHPTAGNTTSGRDNFFLFHRPRTWNKGERKWMGYERKRGKLSALNALLRGRGKAQFSFISEGYEVLYDVKYVITLDSDTKLPREAASKFIAAMAHPLNQAVYDPAKRRVTEGYGILQPRVDASIPQTTASRYLRLQGDLSGIDPYTRVSSDVYQDLFNEGSFIGKGIYDVDIFETALQDVFRDNRILSHDLLEGCYTRSGLLSDVCLYEENPAQYESDLRRHHRWIRGDWQIASWLFPFIRYRDGRLAKNKISALSRWKIFDNLRRSLLPLSLLLLLLLGWSVLPFPWFWTGAVSFIILLSPIIAAAWQLLHPPEDLHMMAHVTEVAVNIENTLTRFITGLAVLPYEAYRYTDAVVRVNWRMFITRKKLLEWTPSASSAGSRYSVGAVWVAPLLALACIWWLWPDRHAMWVSSPIVLLWLAAPGLVYFLGLPVREESPGLSEDQQLFLYQTARKTWAYFEATVTAEDNWLPPDNLQENGVAVIAHRTSPTNMGLALLANLTAYDFGYISGDELLSRCKHTFESLSKLERFRGHFYNWYDTVRLQPLFPRYVSTVDSGNLAGHLLTLKQGLIAYPGEPVLGAQVFKGVQTTAAIVSELLGRPIQLLAPEALSLTVARDTLDAWISLVDQLEAPGMSGVTGKVSDVGGKISDPAGKGSDVVRKEAEEVRKVAEIIETGGVDTETTRWISRLCLQLRDHRDHLERVVPWLDLLPVPLRFDLLAAMEDVPSLLEIQGKADLYLSIIDGYDAGENTAAEKDWLARARTAIVRGAGVAAERILRADELARLCEEMSDLAYDFLLEKSTNLLSIGYNVEEQRRDSGFYDLLASEARLGIFVGIAQGKLPQASWFALGRLLTNSEDPILLSWSGSMFEYLMPQLVMPLYKDTLLYQTSRATVKRQIEYAGQQGVPWGISESAYNMVDAGLNYQYRAFGVPGLGLTRGLEDNLVVAPYASMLALMIAPGKACINLQSLSVNGMEGEYGFFEAMDYTPARVPRGKTFSIVQSYMVHHQGMGFLSLAYLLLDQPMQRRFIAELRFQATLLLLQEKIPRATVFYAHTEDMVEAHTTVANTQLRIIKTPHTRTPEVQLLSNGRYQVMINNVGSGYSRWKDLAVTRWREDPTIDDRGIFCYIRDVQSNEFWSNTYQPTLRTPQSYEVVFSQGHVEFRRHDAGIETYTEVVISPEDDVEMRRVRITNRSLSVKVLEITSYSEVVLAGQAADEAHPAFSNLFVQSEIVEEQRAILCSRRPRSEGEQPPWLFHLVNVQGAAVDAPSYETSRSNFIGRGRDLTRPQAMEVEKLSGSQGAVLDPVVAIRHRVTLKAGRSVTMDLIHGVSETREGCEGLLHKYRDEHLKNRAFELSWTHSQVLLRQINATEEDALLYDQLASAVIYPDAAFRGDTAVIMNNFRGQSGLWSHAVSGDLPIVLLHMYEQENMELARQMIQAHAYWRLKGLPVDLVIWNEDHGSYRQQFQEEMMGLVNLETGGQFANRPGKIYVRSADQVSPEDRILFESVARVIIADNKGTLSEQVNKLFAEKVLPIVLEVKGEMGAGAGPAGRAGVSAAVNGGVLGGLLAGVGLGGGGNRESGGTDAGMGGAGAGRNAEPLSLPADLLFFNGKGGFRADGKEYLLITDKNNTTPAPWVNVLANADFGSVVSESGSAYSWAINAHEYRITPWSDDPVSDAGGEAFYLRDEDSGVFWSPMPYPATGVSPYITTHGFGYSQFRHVEGGIATDVCVFVDKLLPVKFIVLKISNLSGRKCKLSATGYIETILGDLSSKTAMHILSEQEVTSGALLFRNRYNTSFAERVSFFHVDETNQLSWTTDRSSFIGRNKNLEDPQALYRKKLSGRTGAAMDPCGALQVKFELADGGEKEIVFQIGSAANTQDVLALIGKVSGEGVATRSLAEVKAYWQQVIGAVQVKTPDPAFNILGNGWLVYQTLACRIFGRSGFYQSGGAFGFRDQLQDVLALLFTQPLLAKEQILLHASRQFVEGDVQHWWHPPEGRGVRTHCSDDMLWLPFVTGRYLKATGDSGLLDLPAGFLESRLLQPEEDSLYDLPVSGNLSGSVYEHCVRAIKHSLRFGVHGLPLMGTGDWNDGMDQVGHKGQGESVWLAFFLYDILIRFAVIARERGDGVFGSLCEQQAVLLQSNIEAGSWDGEWYRRAYFDDGTPLGSSENEECRIDSISQSWSVLSGAAGSERRVMAMDSLYEHLVRKDLRLIQLLDPPFHAQGLNPGYIKGYVPGVRENGGQYSHAAIWTLMAFAELGDREKVWELFSMICPLNHAANAADAAVYKVEPYIMAADVYANESHKGMGGWTWYTGSAGWMYQFMIGSLLGMSIEGDKLYFKPCFPKEWSSVTIDYRYGSAVYKISLLQSKDGRQDGPVQLVDDGREHVVEVYG